MKDIQKILVCACGNKTVHEAVEIFQKTSLPYKKAKKLVTGCSKTCCRRPLMALYQMVDFGFVDYEEIHFLIEAMNDRMKE